MKKTILIILLLVSPLCLMANVPLAVSIGGPKKISTGSSKVPYTCDVQGNLNGTILSYCWTCMGENGEDYSDLFDGGTTNTYRIYINDAPTNFWLDVYMYYRSNTDSNEYVLSTGERIQVMKPVFNIERQAGLNGGNPNEFTNIPMHFNIDDDDSSSEPGSLVNCGEDYLQTSYIASNKEDDMLFFKVSTTEPGLEIKYGRMKVVVSENAKIWKSKNKGINNLLLSPNSTTEVDGSTSEGRSLMTSLLKGKVYLEGVGLGDIAINIKYNNEEVANMPYKSYAPVAGRIPAREERQWCKNYFPNMDGCEFSIKSDYAERDCPYYNCIAYAILPNMSSNPSLRFWVQDFFRSNGWQYSAHTNLMTSFTYALYTHGGVRYTSVDLFGNQNFALDNIDLANFFAFFRCVEVYYYNSADFFYFSEYHAALKATLNEKMGFYHPNDVVVSKCGGGPIIIHYASAVVDEYGFITKWFMYDPI